MVLRACESKSDISHSLHPKKNTTAERYKNVNNGGGGGGGDGDNKRMAKRQSNK